MSTTDYPGSHSRGPSYGDHEDMRGLFEDVPHAFTDQARGRYKVWVEQFPHVFADGQLELSGATVLDINTPTAPSETVTMAGGGLILNAGTAASSGVQAQFNIASNAAATNPRLNVMSPITFGGAAFNNKEFLFFTRFGIQQSDSVTWGGIVMLGTFITDTSLVNPTTGVPSVATTGGAGLHIGPTGVVSVVQDQGALTVADILTARQVDSVATLTAAGTPQWYEYGFRYKQISATDATGVTTHYYGKAGSMQKVLTLGGTSGFLTSAQSVSFTVVNGITGTTNLADLTIESIVTGTTRAGS